MALGFGCALLIFLAKVPYNKDDRDGLALRRQSGAVMYKRYQVVWGTHVWGMCVLLALSWLLSACSCQSVAIELPTPPTSSQAGKGKQQETNPPAPHIPDISDITNDKQTYAVSGVSALTFYPKEHTGQEGAFGGYALFYSQPQDVNVQFAALQDGECTFLAQDGTTTPDIDFVGVDVGMNLGVQFPQHQWNWSRNPFLWHQKPAGVYYLGESVERMKFPYEQPVSMRAEGRAEIPAFSISWQSPARLVLTQPLVDFTKPLKVPRSQSLDLSWTFVGVAPYLAVRINQNDQSHQKFRSLTCRYASQGPGKIPSQFLSQFQPDPSGNSTHIFFFAGRYLLAKIPGFSRPFFLVMEAITTSSVIME